MSVIIPILYLVIVYSVAAPWVTLLPLIHVTYRYVPVVSAERCDGSP